MTRRSDMSQPNMACGRIATTWGRARDDAWKGTRRRGEGRVTMRGRARDDTWKGARRRVDGCDDARQKGARGARGVVMRPKTTSGGFLKFRLKTKEHGKTKTYL